MILGIDASNIRAGGGLTHLAELLAAARPESDGFSRVVVWGGSATLARLADQPWLVKAAQPELDLGLLRRSWWQYRRLSRLARQAACDVLLVPGGSYAGTFRPVVSISQNLLPFEWREMRRFGWSWMTLKLMLLRLTQGRTFRGSDGIIFLTQYARETVLKSIGGTGALTAIIPHGIAPRFSHPPRVQQDMAQYAMENPIRILYVSIVDVYKHQNKVARAVAMLRDEGLPIRLGLVGPAYPPALTRLKKTLEALRLDGDGVIYHGAVAYQDLPAHYAHADVFLYASSCENLPIILLEGMSAGLPTASSNRGPMPEVLGDAGVYFDPENPEDIASALRKLLASPALRTQLAQAVADRAKRYSWRQCSAETFSFLARVAQGQSFGSAERKFFQHD
ncbi:MAG: glycosyltransferase family 4 protein [Candidatus Protistobacter heckmanni]|nr:glycosyltransferase family 4 protein [Candidatus Protistobacter heckmanni]